MRGLIFIFLSASLLAEDGKQNQSDSQAAREKVASATIEYQDAVIRMLQLQADPVYRAALARVESTEREMKEAKAAVERSKSTPPK